MYPAVLGKDEPVQVFTEVFHHVVTLGLAVHQHVQPQPLLLGNRLLDVFGNPGAVVIRIQIPLFEVQTQAADFGGLREGTDSGGWPRGQVEAGALGFGTDFIRALALAVLSGDGRQAFFHRRVVHASRVAARLDWRTPFANRRRVAAVQRIAQQRQLFTFLQGEGKPAFYFRVETGFHAQIDRTVQQRAGRGHPQLTFANDVFNLCVFLGQIGAPDVTAVDQTGGEQPVCWQALVQFCDVIFAVHQVNVQTLHRQSGDGAEVRRHTFKVGGKQQLHLPVECIVSRFESIKPNLRQLKHQRGLVDLHPLNAAFAQFNQHLFVDRQNVLQQAQTIELLAFDFPQPQIGHWPQQYGFHLVAQRQRFVHFIQKLRPGQPELLPFYELRHHISTDPSLF